MIDPKIDAWKDIPRNFPPKHGVFTVHVGDPTTRFFFTHLGLLNSFDDPFLSQHESCRRWGQHGNKERISLQKLKKRGDPHFEAAQKLATRVTVRFLCFDATKLARTLAPQTMDMPAMSSHYWHLLALLHHISTRKDWGYPSTASDKLVALKNKEDVGN